jgi:predicted methyltransferase
MHADLNSETLRAMARDPMLYDEAFYSILLWMLSHPGQPAFSLSSIVGNSRYQRLGGARNAMDTLRRAGYVTVVGKDEQGLELYQASPKPCFDDLGVYVGEHAGDR